MNYKQNDKINQVNEFTLVVGADIAKHNHYARSVDFRGIELGKPLKFTNLDEGFQGLLQWIQQLMKDHQKLNVMVGVEPTGHYWLSLAEFLRSEGIPLVLVNPMHVKKSKELDDNNPTKHDLKDALVIAKLVKDGRYSVPHLPEGIYAELRNGMNLRERLSQEITRVQGRIQNWLDRFFPEFTQVFKDWQGKAAHLTLKHFPLPQDVVGMGAEKIVEAWKKEVKRAVGLKRAEHLHQAAKKSVGLTTGTRMARQELQSLLRQYDLLMEEMELCMKEIEVILAEIPGVPKMLTIPGVGLITVAGFLAEVGDLSHYKHPRQIQKLAGLNLKENSSGKHKGQTRITKRGRPRLRALLFRCILPLVAKNEDFKALHREYTTRSVNPLKKKQSLVALCCKLIRILFALGRKNESYDSSKWRQPQTQTQQNAA